MEKPSVVWVSSTKHSVLLKWQMSDPNPPKEPIYKVIMKGPSKLWETKFWGFGTEKEIKGLGPEELYYFKVGVTLDLENEEVWSDEITTATKEDYARLFNLFRGVDKNHPGVIRSIIQQRYKALEAYDNMGETALIRASKLGHKEAVVVLLGYGARVNAQGYYNGKTALMYTAFSGNKGIADLLTKKKASWSLTDRTKSTALHYAADNEQHDMIEYALRNGADINCIDCNGWTPLMRAAILGSNANTLKLLIEHGARVDIADDKGQTALDLARSEEMITFLSQYLSENRPKTSGNISEKSDATKTVG